MRKVKRFSAWFVSSACDHCGYNSLFMDTYAVNMKIYCDDLSKYIVHLFFYLDYIMVYTSTYLLATSMLVATRSFRITIYQVFNL